MAENTPSLAVEEVPSEIVAQGQGETGLTKAQVQVLASTLLKGLSAPEMGVVFHQAKEYQLSIFRKEIWGFQAKGKLVTMVSRDGLQKIAARHPAYGGIVSAIVYENDQLEIDLGTGAVKHVPARSARGKVQGAWAKVNRKGYEPLTVFITVDEVRQSFWSDRQAADMTLVRAEARALRRAEVGTGGVYLEEEFEPAQELAESAPAKIEAAQEKAKEAAETVRKRRKAAAIKETFAPFDASGSNPEIKEAVETANKVRPLIAEMEIKAQGLEEAAQPEAKAFEESNQEVKESAACEGVETVKEIWAAWLDDRLPKNILENRRKDALELFRFLGAVLEIEDMASFNLAYLSGYQKRNALAAIRERNDGLFPTDNPPVLMASKEQVAALAKAMGGETWLKKHMRRAFGHDNAYALTAEQAEQLKASLNPAAVKSVDETLAQVAEKERAAGDQAPKSAAERLLAAWQDHNLADSVLSIRDVAGLNAFCERKTGKSGARYDELTPTGCEAMISAVLSRNAEAPKK